MHQGFNLNHVGDHLVDHARKSKSNEEINLFVRSAYNRYYYACFLRIRDLILTLEGRSEDTIEIAMKHASLPDHLNGKKLKNKIKKAIKRAYSYDLISLKEKNDYQAKVNESLYKLAEILNQARPIRTAADYDLEKEIKTNGNDYVLDDTSLKVAADWARRTNISCNIILSVWSKVK